MEVLVCHRWSRAHHREEGGGNEDCGEGAESRNRGAEGGGGTTNLIRSIPSSVFEHLCRQAGLSTIDRLVSSHGRHDKTPTSCLIRSPRPRRTKHFFRHSFLRAAGGGMGRRACCFRRTLQYQRRTTSRMPAPPVNQTILYAKNKKTPQNT